MGIGSSYFGSIVGIVFLLPLTLIIIAIRAHRDQPKDEWHPHGLTKMRRLINDEWQYREMTEAEKRKRLIRSAW
ncbi:hypothetical protein [Bradyrhizobium sp. ARR65]|uniref:hypothetical protein n=1 Tax=Bradyrhizobium sp. ARR65 TaxID=1040989 RepID=UPI0004650C47|nr:hypothetical protein [Bradyrhizobium sp. ARR65]